MTVTTVVVEKKKTKKQIEEEKRRLIAWDSENFCLRCEGLIDLRLNCARGRFYGKEDEKVDIFFVGEAPGEFELREGRFFVGPAGHELIRWIEQAGISEDVSIYLDNAVRCSLNSGDIGNASTVQQKKLIMNCRPYLSKELARLKPKVIVALGNTALKSLCGISGITRWRGRTLYHPEASAFIIPTFHPASILRGNVFRVEQVINDIKKALVLVDRVVLKRRPKVIFVNSQKDFDRCIKLMSKADHFAVDLETNGYDAWAKDAKIIGISLSCSRNVGFFVPFMFWEENLLGGDGKWVPDDRWISPVWIKVLKKLLESKKNIKIFHNAGFDLIWLLRREGINVQSIYDTLIVNHVIDDIDNDLKSLAYLYTNFAGYEDEMNSYRKNSKSPFTEVPPSVLARYGVYDAVATFIIYEKQKEMLEGNPVASLIPELNELRYNLTQMEMMGCRIDRDEVKEAQIKKGKELANWLEYLREETKSPELNLDSPKQLLPVFFGEDGVFKGLYNGKPSTDKKVMELIANKLKGKKTKKAKRQREVLEKFVGYRKGSKKLSSYIDTFLVNSEGDGRVHPWFKVYSTKTGRLSGNLQQVPRGDEIRRFIVAGEGKKLMEFDFAQLEMKILAEFCKDERLLHLFATGGDLHVIVGQQSIKRLDGSDYPVEYFTGEMKEGNLRPAAKIIGFSAIYGKTYVTLADDLGITEDKARDILALLFDGFPGIRLWMETIYDQVFAKGYVETLFCRRLPVFGWQSTDKIERAAVRRKAVNYPVQSSASDCVVKAINRVCRMLGMKKLAVDMWLTVHDSLLCEADEKIVDEVSPLIKMEMEKPIPEVRDVKLTVDCKIGMNWGLMD